MKTALANAMVIFMTVLSVSCMDLFAWTQDNNTDI